MAHQLQQFGATVPGLDQYVAWFGAWRSRVVLGDVAIKQLYDGYKDGYMMAIKMATI